jgi:hypothetical protein
MAATLLLLLGPLLPSLLLLLLAWLPQPPVVLCVQHKNMPCWGRASSTHADNLGVLRVCWWKS